MTTIRVTSNGQTIGTLTAEEFRRAQHGAPSTAFLPDLIERFNTWKAQIGEPERAELVITAPVTTGKGKSRLTRAQKAALAAYNRALAAEDRYLGSVFVTPGRSAQRRSEDPRRL